ncbi:MAG TPA: polynucleotide adenylyltransferase PcnB [Fluviicoccus sp.]|nr:polynucleotide adenylyltransferase PcnB [Fluviicoccus sp.]
MSRHNHPLQPVIYRDTESGLDINDFSDAAHHVVKQLDAAGYAAYVVGGSVRDSLLGLHPKDFDVATNATPDQIKHVFGRQCQIIGRRFLLAHVYHNRHMIEVATFRAPHHEGSHGQTSDHGMITRDNVWGRVDQDALRRDFTINALYYQPLTGEILDFADGMKDIRAKKLRMIGDAAVRYREDPVRMLRALRFAAKLGFSLEKNTAAPIRSLAYLLGSISHHRLYDESLKLFSCGHLDVLMPGLQFSGLLSQLFPHIRESGHLPALVTLAARNTDERLRQGKTVNPAFFYAVLLWDLHQNILQQQLDAGEPLLAAYQQAAIQALGQQYQRTAIPKHASQTVREIWEMQPRLQRPKSRQVPELLASPRFRAAFDFLLLREMTGDKNTNGMAVWWEEYQTAHDDHREQMLRQLDRPASSKRKPGKKQPAHAAAPAAPESGEA